MPRRLFEELKNWVGGVVTAAAADTPLPNSSPRGRNSSLTQLAPGLAEVSRRRGAVPALTARLSGEPAIIGQTEFIKANGTAYHVLVGSDGSLRLRNLDGTSTVIAAAAFTSTDLPSFAVANDLLFIANGTDRIKFDGTNVRAWGITAPAAGPTLSAAAGGSMAAGVYDVLLTYYASAYGNESGRGVLSSVTLAAGQKINVSWTFPADAQVDYVRVYIRSRTRGANFYRAVAGATPAAHATHGGYASTTLAAVLDITDAQFAAFTTLAPAANANQPPPSGAQSPTWHDSRMFVHDERGLYWTDIESPEGFNLVDSFEPINPDDGDPLVALASIDEGLLTLKRNSTWLLDGNDPNSWIPRRLSTSLGAVNQQSVAVTDNGTYWWDKDKGPARLRGGKPEAFGLPRIGPSLTATRFNQSLLHLITAVEDTSPARQRLMYAVPEAGSTRPSLILPYNLALEVWESDGWNPFDVASMARARNTTGDETVFIGGYTGRLFEWWSGMTDGVTTGQKPEGLVTAAAATTLTGVLAGGVASPAWTVDAHKGLYVYAISANDEVQRRLITANTANTLTVSVAWSTNPNSTYRFIIGGIDFQFDTPWMTAEAPFHKKRFEFLFVQLGESTDAIVRADIELFLTYDRLNAQLTTEFELSSGAVYDAATYDVSRYASPQQDDTKIRVSRTGKAWRVRLRNITAAYDTVIKQVAMQSVLLTTKG